MIKDKVAVLIAAGTGMGAESAKKLSFDGSAWIGCAF